MNRISLALIFILITAFLCAAEYQYVDKTVAKYSMELSQIEEHLNNGDREGALKISAESDINWQQDSSTIDMLLFHDYVDDIGEDICTIKKHIENGDDSEAIVVCEKTRRELNSLIESEKPLPKNII